MPQENKQEDKQKNEAAQPSRAPIDAACLRMAESALTVKNRCDEFEALLLIPNRTLAAVRQASAAVRLAGMQSMGLTTAYLAELSRYIKAVEDMKAVETAA